MPATFAPSAAPANALLIWTDGRSIYVELPSKANVRPASSPIACPKVGFPRPYLSSANTRTLQEPQVSVPVRPGYVGSVAQHALAESILRKKGL